MQRRLKEAGFLDAQADVLTGEVANIVPGQLATKSDVSDLRTKLPGKFADMDGKFVQIDGRFVQHRSNRQQVRSTRFDGRFAEVKSPSRNPSLPT